MPEQLSHFPRLRLVRRIWQDTEATLGSLPMLFITAIVVAALATALALTQPDQTVKNGHVLSPSYVTTFLLTVGGGVGGLAATALLTFSALLGRYLFRGDGSWDAAYLDLNPPGADQPLAFFELRCKTAPVLDLFMLGDMECVVATPTGAMRSAEFMTPIRQQGRMSAQFPGATRGTYKVRWYGTRHRAKHVEIARATVPIPLQPAPSRREPAT
jgi:hypothetical protein